MYTVRSALVVSIGIAFGSLLAISSVEDVNMNADKLFLEWKLTDTDVLGDTLRKALTPNHRIEIAKETAISLDDHPTKKEISNQVLSIMNDFLKKIGPESAAKIPKRQLRNLINELISPDYVFEKDNSSSYHLDIIYNEMIDTLFDRRTPAGTTLKDWALRFLTSESVTIAIESLRKLKLNNKKFVQLTPIQKERIIEPIVELVANRFITNLEPVKRTYHLVLPDRIDDAIKYKVRRFLSEKFISR